MSDVAVGPLDLSGADTSGFEPVKSGLYKAAVFSAEWKQAKGEGKLPAGTPMLNVQFVLNEKVGEPDYKVENRRVFTNYNIPPADYADAQASARMKGMFVNMLKAAGYDEKKITKPGFSLDLEELQGKELCLLLGIQPENTEKGYAAQNTVKGTKSIDAASSSSTGLM